MNYKFVAIACILASALSAKNYQVPGQEQEEETPTRPVTPQPLPLAQASAIMNWQGASGTLNQERAHTGRVRGLGPRRRAIALSPDQAAALQADITTARTLE